MSKSSQTKHLTDNYRFPGFVPKHEVSGIFGDQKARVITLTRRTKKVFAERVEYTHFLSTTESEDEFGIFPQETLGFSSILRYGESTVLFATL